VKHQCHCGNLAQFETSDGSWLCQKHAQILVECGEAKLMCKVCAAKDQHDHALRCPKYGRRPKYLSTRILPSITEEYAATRTKYSR
jgi:hypothetical protein